VQAEHAQADESCQQAEGIEQLPEVAVVADAQVGIELNRHAQQQVAEGHAEHQGRYQPADAQPPVPALSPAGILQLAAVIEADRAHEKGEQHDQHCPVEAGERGGIDQRPGGE